MAGGSLESAPDGSAPDIAAPDGTTPSIIAPEGRKTPNVRGTLERTREASFEALPPRLESGETLDSFRVRREIARGATAAVFCAEDFVRREEVALKVLSPHLGVVPAAVARFRREAALAVQAGGPGVIPVYRSGLARGHHYYVMELQSGETADGLAIPEGRGADCEGAYRRMAFAFARVARTLHRLHTLGFVHRDVKPENLLVGANGQLILCDFGSAMDARRATGDAGEGLWGTVRYMSPEQFLPDADPCDPRIDVYALGMTIFEVVTGSLIFPRCSAEEIAHYKLTRLPPAPRHVDPKVPLGLDSILRQAMEPYPQLRYATAAEFADDLERFATLRRGHRR